MKEIIVDNINCIIGSSASENWEIFSNAKPYHIFFHLSSFSSCYVILETNGEYPTIETITKVALICKTNTKYKNVPNIKIDYTFCENITKGDKVGEVIYKSNRKVKQIKI
jgi:predicted ribosome quality control (RQC) complex YloA/Tae2 family protein